MRSNRLSYRPVNRGQLYLGELVPLGEGDLEAAHQVGAQVVDERRHGAQRGQQDDVDRADHGGGAAVIGAINIVLMTALCTVAAFIYNMCSDLVGGLEVTLSERD